MNELQFLCALKNAGGSMQYTDLLNLGLAEPVHDPNSDRKRIVHLRDLGEITGELKAYKRLEITPKGIARLDAEKQELDKIIEDRTYDSANQRRQNKFSLLSAFLVAAFGSALTLIVEHIAVPLVRHLLALL